MKKPIIEFKNVSKVFEDNNTVVLKDINFELEEGKFYTLLGSSGSGKSTILNIIAGLLDATDGDIFLGPITSPRAELSKLGHGVNAIYTV